MEGKIIERPAGYFNNLEEFAKEDSSEILNAKIMRRHSLNLCLHLLGKLYLKIKQEI